MLLLFTHPNTYNKWQHKNSTLTAFRFLHFSLSTSTSTSTLIHYIYIYYYYYLLLLLTNHLKFFYIYFYISFFLSLSNLFIFIFFNISLINSTSTYLFTFITTPSHHFIPKNFFFPYLEILFLYKFGDQKKFINNFFLQPIHPLQSIHLLILV